MTSLQAILFERSTRSWLPADAPRLATWRSQLFQRFPDSISPRQKYRAIDLPVAPGILCVSTGTEARREASRSNRGKDFDGTPRPIASRDAGTRSRSEDGRYSAAVLRNIRVERSTPSFREWGRENDRGRETGTAWRKRKRGRKEARCLGEQNKLVKPLNDP